MGARNTSGVMLMWSHLDDGAFRLLSGLAHRSLDQATVLENTRYWPGPTPAGRYFAGVDELVTLVRSHDAKGNVRSHAARRSAAFRYLAQLRAAGAVKVLTSAVNGDRAEYALNVNPLTVDEFEALTEDPRVDRSRAVEAPSEKRGANLPSVRASRTPQRPSQSDAPREEQPKEPPRSNDKEKPALKVSVTSRATTASDGHTIESTGQVWHDVPLVDADDVDAIEVYDSAAAHLARTVGTERGAELAAAYFKTTYTRAVVDAAAACGWTP